MSSLRDFLLTVDATRNEDFVNEAISLLKSQCITELTHLGDADPSEWVWSPSVCVSLCFFVLLRALRCDQISGGMRTYFRKAVKAYAAKHPPTSEPPGQVAVVQTDKDDLQLALINALGGKKSLKQQLDEFDMDAGMARLGFQVAVLSALFA